MTGQKYNVVCHLLGVKLLSACTVGNNSEFSTLVSTQNKKLSLEPPGDCCGPEGATVGRQLFQGALSKETAHCISSSKTKPAIQLYNDNSKLTEMKMCSGMSCFF